jgi:CheY-like chemotaxis protein
MINILVVDDSCVERSLASALLSEQAGFRVCFAEDGCQALDKMRQSAPDLVITDLVMPEMDGLELVRATRREFPSIPVILMTAYGNESLAVDALYEGAASYVPKAKRAERLVETVNRVVARTLANRRPNQLKNCLGKLDATFYLDNDPDSIPPLLDYVQLLVGGLELSDETEQIRAGLALEEALVRAMCHGNLELTAEDLDRGRTAGPDGLNEVIARRRSKSPYRDRKIELEVHVTNRTARFVVRDGGDGSDREPDRRFTRQDCFEKGNGIGIALMNMLMDNVSYNDIGNEVTLIKVSRN